MKMSNSWRHDTTAFDKRKKGLRGCPNCYKKTYVMYEIGETCPNCGSVVGVYYFFQSKHQMGDDGDFAWVRCQSEESCMKMAQNGYKVKKVMEKKE